MMGLSKDNGSAHHRGLFYTQEGRIMSAINPAVVMAVVSGEYWTDRKGLVLNAEGEVKIFCKENPKVILLLGGMPYEVPVRKIVAFEKFGLDAFECGVKIRHANEDIRDNSYENIIKNNRGKKL